MGVTEGHPAPGAPMSKPCPTPLKRDYPTKAHALMVAGRGNLAGTLSAYKCPGCRKWHLTRQRQKRA